MKLISWNVNGIRSAIGKGLVDFVKKKDPDIFCVQETKAEEGQAVLLPEYLQFWNSAEKKGYSGTLVFSKAKPLSFTKDMGIPEHDLEGRVITLEYEGFYLVNVYAPNAQRGLMRLDYKVKWNADFLAFIKKLGEKKPVIFCGDMNVAHQEIDIARPKDNRNNAGFTDAEREGFSRMLDSGFIDTFRLLHPDEVAYTWWSYMFNARAKNIGWRIDYFCVSEELKEKVSAAYILPEVMGSDHCPVGLEIARI